MQPSLRLSQVLRTQLFIACVAGLCNPLAHAQQAPNSGRGLERNLQAPSRDLRGDRTGRGLERDLRVGGTGNYRDNSFANELAYRNAIVTGNVGGGKSFRGDAGYTAPDEFRSALASDDTFAFRRDSVSSGMFGRGLRGTESVQFQYSYTTGNNRIMRRLDGTLSSEPGSTDLREGTNRNASMNMGTIRSTSAYAAARALTPQMVSMRNTPIGTEQTSASNLIGVRTHLLPQEPTTKTINPLSAPSAAGKATDNSASPERIDTSFKTAYNEIAGRLDARPLPPRPTAKPDATNPDATSPDNLKPTETNPATPGTPPGIPPGTGTPPGTPPKTPGGTATPDNGQPPSANIPEWRIRIDELREGWQVNRRAAATDRAKPRTPTTTTGEGQPGERPAVKPTEIDPEVAELIRSAGGIVSAYAVGPGTGEAFSEHLRAGQALLAAGQYFDAEERFARALSYRPGEITAQAGRAHAQLGAGLMLSAAINLHTMLRENPEMIAVRYSGGTFPTKERLASVVTTLRGEVARMAALDLNPPQDAAFLIAYIGFQTDDRAMISEGLAGLSAATNQADADLTAFLAEIWLAEGPLAPLPAAPAPETTPAPATLPAAETQPQAPGK